MIKPKCKYCEDTGYVFMYGVNKDGTNNENDHSCIACKCELGSKEATIVHTGYGKGWRYPQWNGQMHQNLKYKTLVFALPHRLKDIEYKKWDINERERV